MKHQAQNRVLSFFLALVMLCTNVPFPAISVEPDQQVVTKQPNQGELVYDCDTLKITKDGTQISSLALQSHEKILISADGISSSAAYQWQVEHPEKDGVWVNVYDGTQQNISVTLALVESVLRADGTAKLRCRAYTDDYAYLTNTLTVTLCSEVQSVGTVTGENKTLLAAADGDPVTPEFVTVTIEYVLYQNVLQDDDITFVETEVGSAFTSYVATLQYNSPTPLITSVHCPTIVGYMPTLVKVTEGSAERLPRADEFVDDYVVISQSNLTHNVVYRVEYRPANVKYEVRYFFQNIYDDLYVENASLVTSTVKDGEGNPVEYPVITTGKTGTHPNKDYTAAVFTGFTSLYYEPELIAADGSTVFHVYYERNYYLMEFDCNGGYGTDTVYVRYGTHISVPSPAKSGYVFDGWDMVQTDGPNPPALGAGPDKNGRYEGDKAANELPPNMPNYNTAYKALWKAVNTTYKIAYWLEDGTQKSYIGGYMEAAVSGTNVSGGNSLGRTGIGAVCGKLGHIHTGECFNCGEAGHVHDTSCLPDAISVGGIVSDQNSNDFKGMEAAKAAAGANFDPDEVYIFMIQADSDKDWRYWPKLYINGTYYNMTADGSDRIHYKETAGIQTMANITVGDAVADGTDVHKATIFKANLSSGCNTTAHVHANLCYICNNTADDHVHDEKCVKCKTHQHSLECRKDAHYLTYIRADKDVLVEGDGSSVVNIYYSYRSYTMRFYYARSKEVDGKTEYSVVGGSTYYFGGQGNYADYSVEQLLANVPDGQDNSQWGRVVDKPTIKDKYKDRYVTDNIEYNGYKYYYLEFTAQYGSDLENLWPIDIFNPVAIPDDEVHSQCEGLKYAYFSAWNGEHKVKYTQDNASIQGYGWNETIKGLYMYLDEEIIFDQRFEEVSHTDTFGNHTSLVNFLGFWDNGANIGWSVPHQFTYHIMIETSEDVSEKYEQYGKKNYKEYKSFVVYDNSNLTDISKQTAVALKGHSHVGTVTYNASYDTDYQADTPVLQSVDFYFYYDTNIHTITFWNHSEPLSDGKGASVKYGADLNQYGTYASAMVQSETNPTGKYPSKLEPGAYYFDGWYTSEACLPCTEMDWTQTMPDSDFIVYAKWEAKIRDVYFYYNYEDYTSALAASEEDKDSYYWYHTDGEGNPKPDQYPIEVQHGSLLNTVYSSTPIPMEGYTFVGWFYIDEQGKKRFAPDTMEVKKELHLFAEWQSTIDTEYKVQYVLDETDGLNPAGTPVAAPTEGHLTAGKTKTFQAKVTTNLYEQFRDAPLFPLANSHSILMESEKENNTYTFRYKRDEKVFYLVRYVNKITGVELCDPKIQDSGVAIVTEKFLPFTGFIPDDYFIRKVLAYDGPENNSKTPATATEDDVNEYNEIIFYYTPDEEHALYTIEYYTQNLDGTWPDQPVESVIGSDDLDENVPISIDGGKFTGFTYDHSEVYTYTKDSSGNYQPNAMISKTETDFEAKLTEGGLEVKVYFTRNQYQYTIKYEEHGTGKILGYKTVDSDALLNAYAQDADHTVNFGTLIEHNACSSSGV